MNKHFKFNIMKKIFFNIILTFCFMLFCIIIQGCTVHHKHVQPQPVYMTPIHYNKPKPKYKPKPFYKRTPNRRTPFKPNYLYDNSNLIA